MGTLLKRIYEHVHIIANFSATTDLIQSRNNNNSFNTSHTGILFIRYQKIKSNIGDLRTI